ncbi:MAG: fatty acid desaturase [Pseudohongiellaceae bacterium]|jgi:fatty acid desaturase
MSSEEINSHLPSKEEYFLELKKTPALSLPAFGLFLLGLIIMAGGSYMSLTGKMPMWGATLTNGVGLYLLFTIMHEAMHRALSSNNFVNDFLGRFSMMLLIPAAPFEIGRWAHFQHHRFTSDERDPDQFIHHGKWWTIPVRWANFDLYYLYCFFRDGGKQKERHSKSLLITLALFAVVISTLIYFGFGMELLFLWFLPTRIALAMIALIFVFLPHYPGDISAEENEYQASTIRRGWEWLLTPIFVYQNYHLIHHLWPTAPFYNYIKIWHLKYDEIAAYNPAIQKSFGLTPINYEKKSEFTPVNRDNKTTNSGGL